MKLVNSIVGGAAIASLASGAWAEELSGELTILNWLGGTEGGTAGGLHLRIGH